MSDETHKLEAEVRPLEGGPIRVVLIETLSPPSEYSWKQVEMACAITASFNRGKFVLCEEPQR